MINIMLVYKTEQWKSKTIHDALQKHYVKKSVGKVFCQKCLKRFLPILSDCTIIKYASYFFCWTSDLPVIPS